MKKLTQCIIVHGWIRCHLNVRWEEIMVFASLCWIDRHIEYKKSTKSQIIIYRCLMSDMNLITIWMTWQIYWYVDVIHGKLKLMLTVDMSVNVSCVDGCKRYRYTTQRTINDDSHWVWVVRPNGLVIACSSVIFMDLDILLSIREREMASADVGAANAAC